MQARIDIGYNSVRIYINDVVHVSFKKSELLGIQAWIEDSSTNVYWIRYYLNGKKDIKCAYWEPDNWSTIMKLLDTEEIYN